VHGGLGLSRLSTGELERLLSAVHAGRVTFPLSRASMTLAGFSDVADRADTLLGLDERGTRAVLVAVLAERRRTAAPP
jgi:hypothetical protein